MNRPKLSRFCGTGVASAVFSGHLWLAGLLSLGVCGCDDTGTATATATDGQCGAGAACADVTAGADGAGTVYGDQHSGPLNWADGGAVVFDSQSGLLWQRDVSADTHTWDAAIAYCAQLVLAGQNDWQLPHRDQLESIVLNLTTAPSIDAEAFPSTPSKPFWTRTLWGPNAAMEAYGVDFESGGTGHAPKTERHFARCVRLPAVRD